MNTVLEKCGEPLARLYSGDRTHWSTYKIGRTSYGNAKSVPIEKWTYRLRRGSYPRILTFHGTTLSKITMGEK